VKRYLLDTHIAVWALSQPKKLSPRTMALLQSEDVFVSALSLWEILTKQQRGRLHLGNQSLVQHVTRAGAQWLPMTAEHVENGLALNALHGDPFDRILVGTARVEQMILLTRDAQILELAAPLLGPLLQEA
jgi:PIN domain nuclease of toxin-antitoxin system